MWMWLDTAAENTRYFSLFIYRETAGSREGQNGARIWTVLVDFEHKNRKPNVLNYWESMFV
jgi:hypothetical protein